MSSNGGRRHLMGGTCVTTVGPPDDYQYDFWKAEFGRCTERCADYEENDASCISDCDYYL